MSQKTMKKIALFISAFMVLSVLLGIITPLIIYADQSTQDKLDQAQQELKDLATQREEIEQELKQIESSQSNLQNQITLLDKQIVTTSAEITATQVAINALTDSIVIQEKNLEDAIKRMDEQYDSFRTQVRTTYKMGDTSYMDIILGSNDFFDMLARMQLSKEIMDHSKQVFENYTNLANEVEFVKNSLQHDKQVQEGYKTNLTEQKKSLEKSSAQSEEKMKQLLADEQAAKSAEAANIKAEEEMAVRVAMLSMELAGSGSYVGGELTWPTPSSTRITSPFGYRTHPITGKYSLHTGVDVGASGGADILSANTGVVIVSDYHSAYGNYVMVDHGGGTVTLYAHMSKRLVSVGETVLRAQKIGLVGTTGWSTGNHLHFEVIKNGEHTNPLDYFS